MATEVNSHQVKINLKSNLFMRELSMISRVLFGGKLKESCFVQGISWVKRIKKHFFLSPGTFTFLVNNTLPCIFQYNHIQVKNLFDTILI